MILLYLFIVLVVLDFIINRNKILLLINFIFMWIMMGWSFGNADYNVYYNRYYYPQNYTTLEPLYAMLQTIAKNMGFEYFEFLIIMSGLCLFIRFFVIFKLVERYNIVLGLYLIYPFIFDITQIREFYAITIVMLGVYFLLKLKKFSVLFFIISVCIASFIHSSTIWYLFLLIPYYNKDNVIVFLKKSIIYFITVIALSLSGFLNKIINIIAQLVGFGNKYIQTVQVNQESYTQNNRFVYVSEIILIFLMVGVAFFISKKEYEINNENISIKLDYFQWSEKVNILMLLVIPLIWQSADIYRIQQGFLIIFYTIFVSSIKNYGANKVGFKSFISFIIFLILAVVFLYLIIGFPSLRDSVFLPAFFDNKILK